MNWLHYVGLQRRITIYVIVGLLLLATVFTLVTLRAVNQITDVILEERRALATTIAESVDANIRASITQMQSAARLLYTTPLEDLSFHEKSMLQALNSGFQEQATGFAAPGNIQLISSRGNVVWAGDETEVSGSQSDLTRRLAYESILDRSVVVIVTNGPDFGDEALNVSIGLGVPVFGPQDDINGVLIAEMEPAASAQVLLAFHGLEHGAYFLELIDETGLVIASTDGSEIGQVSRHMSVNELGSQELVGGVWEHTTSVDGNDDHIVALVALNTVPWTMALEQEVDVALAVPNSLRDQLFLLTGSALLMGLVLVWMTTRQVVRPLLRLTDTARRIASGDLHTPVTVAGQDEVGTLASSFEVMRRRLEHSLNDFESLLEVARAVGQSLELDKVLPGVLDAVIGGTSAEAAEVWLVEDMEKSVVLRQHRGEAREAFLEIVRLPIGEGFPGIVVQTRLPINVRDLEQDPRFLRQRVKAEGFHVYYALPLIRSGKTLGVLAIASRNPDAFSNENEHRLLELMADHVTVAIENALLHEEVQTLAIFTERERLAREMHDGISQVLGYVNTKAQAVKELIKKGQVKVAVQQMEQLETAARDTYDDVREAILALGTHARNQPFLESLGEYVGRFSDLSDLPTEMIVEGSPIAFNPRVEVQLLRIVQEALANVRKHARASGAKVVISFRPNGCRIMVEDDGRGFDPQSFARGPWPHMGLQSMRERAMSIGGRLIVDSESGNGTRVVLDLPEVST